MRAAAAGAQGHAILLERRHANEDPADVERGRVAVSRVVGRRRAKRAAEHRVRDVADVLLHRRGRHSIVVEHLDGREGALVHSHAACTAAGHDGLVGDVESLGRAAHVLQQLGRIGALALVALVETCGTGTVAP